VLVAATLIAAVVAILYPAPALSARNEERARTARSRLVRDPIAYESAKEMYEVAPTKPFDSEAGRLIAAVDAALADGKTLEEPAAWDSLVKLNPYRMTKEVQGALLRWVRKSSDRLKKNPRLDPTASSSDFERANGLYRSQKLEQASTSYRRILMGSPGRLDVRNNLGLAQMHLGNDLIAKLQFEINRRLDDGYIASGVNIPVVSERLGQREYAAGIARETQESRPGLAQASFNAQWFELFENDNYDRVSSSPTNMNDGSSISPMGTKKKFEELFSIAQALKKGPQARGFWNMGLFGVMEGEAWWLWPLRILALALFLFVAYVVMVASGAAAKRYSFFLFLLIGGLWYILVWGTSRVVQWPAVIYFVAFGLLSMKMSDS